MMMTTAKMWTSSKLKSCHSAKVMLQVKHLCYKLKWDLMGFLIPNDDVCMIIFILFINARSLRNLIWSLLALFRIIKMWAFAISHYTKLRFISSQLIWSLSLTWISLNEIWHRLIWAASWNFLNLTKIVHTTQ